ncbi:restriction endonuclease [Streptomyces sp. TE33382]
MNARRPSRRPVRRSVRRPARCTSRRPGPARSRKRQQVRAGEVLVVAAVGLWALGGILNWLADHFWAVPSVLAVLVAGGALWQRHRIRRNRRRRTRESALRYPLARLDQLHHRDFEYAIRDLMIRDGCRDAVQVGGAGDNGADVKATDPYGRRWVMQCKHRRDGLAGAAVGTPDLQVLNGTGRPVHQGDVIVLVTNGRFTAPAVEFAKTQRLHLVDRGTLGAWAGGSRPLWELLGAVPPPRRPSSLS